MKKHYFQGPRPLRPGKSAFNLSYSKKLTCDMGQLIPVMCEEVVPGDKFVIGNQALVRMPPLVAPIMHQIDMVVHYFYVPYRILDLNFEDFITGGPDGNNAYTLPLWLPNSRAIGSLWDYFGFPLVATSNTAHLPIDYPRRAYNLVWNEYYRDENLQAEISLTGTDDNVLIRNWEKDYFTSSLPWQQRGTAPAFPVTGTTQAVFDPAAFTTYGTSNFANVWGSTIAGDPRIWTDNANATANIEAALNRNTVDLSSAVTFNVADLRLTVQIQRWLERNARGGVRYTEFLHQHFGVSPRDERLQRPEYIGGTKSPIVISEVLQTSETATTPQGNLAGHGMNVSNGFAGSVFCPEFGLVIGLMSIMPKPDYMSQGINRQWLRRSRYDFYFPEFANLSEQAIELREIMSVDPGSAPWTEKIFGYQARYDEMRTKQNLICGQMRTTLKNWHLAREFDVNTELALNSSFIQCVPRKDIYAAPSEPGFIVEFGNLIKAIRPIPVTGEPGRLDHD